MKPVVSIIMGSTSDLPVMKKAADLLNEFKVPFEMHALSAHRTPKEVEEFATGAADRGIKVIMHISQVWLLLRLLCLSSVCLSLVRSKVSMPCLP